VQGGMRELSLTDLAFTGSVTPGSLGNLFGKFAVTSHFIQMLAQEGYLKIRAAPFVMAKNGETARITIARETFFSIQPQGVETLFRQDIEKVEAGIMLDITPIVRGDEITVTIENAEVSEDISTPTTGPEISGSFPVINRRRVSTTVHVKDGHTIVIGGLVQRQMVDRVSKIPLLGDLPLVGPLFRQVDRLEQETEVAIFISPRIVRPSQGCSMPYSHNHFSEERP